MELPSLKARLEVLQTLWNKCDKYMVLVELGTNQGFRLINEARDFLLDQNKAENSAYIFAPVIPFFLSFYFIFFNSLMYEPLIQWKYFRTQCPHHEPCPRFMSDEKIPCSFLSRYKPLRVGEPREEDRELYTYLVIKKGSRNDDETIDWPRIMEPPMRRSKHTICRMCTHRGKLEEVIFTSRKHSK